MSKHFGVFALHARTPASNVRPLGPRTAACFACAAAATAAVAVSGGTSRLHLAPPFGLFSGRSKATGQRKRLRLSWLAVDALSGAVGEIAQLAVLYPVDTIKVRCQAQGANAAVILEELRAMGLNMRTVRTLYAGMGSAALCSAVIGAFYLLAFYTVKRVGNDFAQRRQQRLQQQQQQHSSSQQQGRRQQKAQTTGSQLADGTSQRPPLNVEGTHPLVASLAGVSASIIASVFEAPMETYKLRAQAGALGSSSNMLGTMAATAAVQGFGALYRTYGAFMLKSIPYDFAELVTYSGMCDLRDVAAAKRQAAAGAGAAAAAAAAAAGLVAGPAAQQEGVRAGSNWREQMGDMLARSPDGMADMIIGAVAGAAAVLCSMPCDVVKTHMDLHHVQHPCPPGRNAMMHSAAEFFSTGRQLMAQGGVQALFVGVTPRLLQTMPSTMVYWFAVEGTRRALMRYVDVGEAAGEAASPTLGQEQLQPGQAAAALQPAA